jgi:hypothetical protein
MKTNVPDVGDLVIFHDWRALICNLHPVKHSFWKVSRWRQGKPKLGNSERMVLCIGFKYLEESGKTRVRFYDAGQIYEFKFSDYADPESAIFDSIIFRRNK